MTEQSQSTKIVALLRDYAGREIRPMKVPSGRVQVEIAAADAIDHLRFVMRECCDAIRDQDDLGALRMLEVALQECQP